MEIYIPAQKNKNKKNEKKKKKTVFSRHFIGGSAAPANTKRERERERVSEGVSE